MLSCMCREMLWTCSAESHLALGGALGLELEQWSVAGCADLCVSLSQGVLTCVSLSQGVLTCVSLLQGVLTCVSLSQGVLTCVFLCLRVC